MAFIVARKLEQMMDDHKCRLIMFVLDLFSLEERRLIVSKKMKKNKSLFLLAVENDHAYLVNYFIEACNVNVMETGSCLCIAAENGFLRTVKILVENGSDVNQLDPKGFSPLYFACIAGDIKMVMHLIKHGAEVNLVANVERITPLMASLKFPTVCKYLLIKGADPQAMNIYGKTALMMAVEMEFFCERDIRLGNEAEADMDIIKIYEKRCLFYSSQRRTVDLLKSYGSDIDKPLARCYQYQACYAALSGDYDYEIYWNMYTQIQGLPFDMPPFEIENPNSGRSCFAPILNIFNDDHKKVLLYLEANFDFCNSYTFPALATSMQLVNDLINGCKLFSFILKTLASCHNELFFDTLPSINEVYNKLKIMAKHSYDHLKNVDLELLKNYLNHVEEIAARLKKMSKIERCLIAEKIDYVFNIIASLIETLLKKSQGNMLVLKESIEKIVRLDLRGSDNNTLLHFCIKAKYPVEIYKVLLLCNAEVNCRNQCRFTPVHYVLDHVDCDQRTIIEYFLSQGFLFDASNDQEFCLSCSLKERKILPQPVKHTTLKCLAANVVGKTLFSYEEVPSHLEDFILLHT